MLNSTYQERNHWIAIGIGFFGLIYYFSHALAVEGGLGGPVADFVPIISMVIVWTTVIAAILAIANWCLNRDKHVEKDERDRMIELKGYRNAYWVCSILLWTLVVAAMLNESGVAYDLNKRKQTFDTDFVPFPTLNLLLHSVFVIAWASSLVQSTTHVFLYRKGVA